MIMQITVHQDKKGNDMWPRNRKLPFHAKNAPSFIRHTVESTMQLPSIAHNVCQLTGRLLKNELGMMSNEVDAAYVEALAWNFPGVTGKYHETPQSR
jgi:hypothetical protein